MPPAVPPPLDPAAPGAPVPTVPAASGASMLGAVDGLDDELVADLVRCGVTTLDELEERYARAETPVVSNNSAHRATPDVPMLLPEVNPEHLAELLVRDKNENPSNYAMVTISEGAHIVGGKIICVQGWDRGPTEDKGACWEAGELGPVVRKLVEQSREPEGMSPL